MLSGRASVLLSPPGSRLRVGKIGEDTDAWPDGILIVVSLGCLTVQISLPTFGVDAVIFINLHTCIDNAYYVEPHLSQFRKQPLRIGETLAVPGKDPVAIQAVNI